MCIRDRPLANPSKISNMTIFPNLRSANEKAHVAPTFPAPMTAIVLLPVLMLHPLGASTWVFSSLTLLFDHPTCSRGACVSEDQLGIAYLEDVGNAHRSN